MKLSIITVNLNNRDGLKRTIDSVITQTFTDYEWIVIDGGSTDGSRELIRQYSDHFAYWCSEPDKGIYNAMNKGITHTTGDWIQFLNSGDCLFDSTILKQLFSNEYETDVLYGDLQIQSTSIIKKQTDKLSLYYLMNNPFCQQTIFYRKNIFEKHNFDEKYRIVSDIALTIELILEGKKFYHLPLCVISYQSNGISETLMDEHLLERSKLFKEIIPQHIRYDLEIIKHYEDNIFHIYSHRWTNFIFKTYKYRIQLATRIIKKIETLRKSYKKWTKNVFCTDSKLQ